MEMHHYYEPRKVKSAQGDCDEYYFDVILNQGDAELILKTCKSEVEAKAEVERLNAG